MELGHNELKTQLEDAQTSLATALARIETLKVKEKILNQEIAHLRKQLAGDKAGSHAGSGPISPRQPTPTPPAPETEEEEEDINDNNILIGMPTYITELKDQQPVQIHVGSRRVSGSVVVTKGYIDFVEVKARINREEFMGITTAKQDLAAAKTAAGHSKTNTKSAGCMGQLCMGPPSVEGDHPEADLAPRRNSWAGAGTSAMAAAAAGAKGLSSGEFKSWQASALAQRTDSYQPNEPPGVWQILWHGPEATNRITFEATKETREVLHRHTERWLAKANTDDEDVVINGEVEIVSPRHMVSSASAPAPTLAEASSILEPHHLAALAGSLPARFKMRNWQLVYSTSRHGISLATLHRKASHVAPCVLVVRDSGGHVFGAFTPEAWRIAPRFYGTGETFVFQLEPHKVMYPWKVKSRVKNEYFMYSTPDCLGVGGAGHFAIWLDNELLHGHSGACGTFGSPCLAHKEEFRIMAVELWSLA